MDLQQVDVVRVQSLEGLVDCVKYGSTRKSTLVGVVLDLRQLLGVLNSSELWLFADVAVAFCQDDQLLAGQIVLLDRSANDFFRDTV